MKTRLKTSQSKTLWTTCLILSITGCQGGLTGLPSLNSLNNPTRVPPPSTGSFQIPPNYADPANGGASATRTTLGQLRSIETGKTVGDKIESDGIVASEVTNGSFTSKPVVAQSVSTLQSSANQFKRSIEAASAAFGSGIAADSHLASNPSLAHAASASLDSGESEPVVVQAAALNELPDPRFSEATHGSLSSDEGVKWKSPQR